MNLDKTQSRGWKGRVAVFLFGQGISLFGSQLVQMAIIWHVTLETSSGIWVTILTLASFVPQMLISPIAGVWADRYNRKLIMILSDGVIAITTLLLALFMMSGNTGNEALPVIIIVSAIRSLGGGIHSPAVNAALPQIVPQEKLSRINGYNGTIQSIVQFVSPIAAGAIMAIGPIYNILFIDVATAIIGIGILTTLKIPTHQPVPKVEKTSAFEEMREGLRFTWNNRFLRKLFATYGLYIFLCVPSGFLAALMIKRTFGDNIMFLTVSEVVGFAGSVLAGLLLGATGGFKNKVKTLFFGILVYGATSFAIGFTNDFWLFVVLMFFIGFTIPLAQTSVYTLVQEKVEPSMMGRVFSLLHVMFSGFMPLGMAIFGPLADVVRIQTMVIVCAVPIILLAMNLRLSRSFYREGIYTSETREMGDNQV
ncbi:MFS transporter [Paenibacillus sp. FJAT-26967]|uniref:MFS transporter n=1 Tax=Paenibacillus sp. FJAT-26967 TaxID=1729690 RepID=UPI000837AB7B|nr:MFS transporter [Paenibacillus sp. FJAT-26967]